jgi:hypothetical protein
MTMDYDYVIESIGMVMYWIMISHSMSLPTMANGIHWVSFYMASSTMAMVIRLR